MKVAEAPVPSPSACAPASIGVIGSRYQPLQQKHIRGTGLSDAP
jgi:hypothetical protein